jgi:hypothetical protein
VLGRDTHCTRVHLGFPIELSHDSVSHSNVSLGQCCSRHGALLDGPWCRRHPRYGTGSVRQ